MRVDYTVPGLEPATLTDLPGMQEEEASFRQQLRSPTLQVPNRVEDQLRLEERPYTASYIGPPPRPKTLEWADGNSQRLRWRSMLARHSDLVKSAGSMPHGREQPSVEMMLEMLGDMQDLEDAILAESVSLTRG